MSHATQAGGLYFLVGNPARSNIFYLPKHNPHAQKNKTDSAVFKAKLD